MSGFNKVILIGNMTADIELKYSKAGKAFGNFTLAVTTGFGEKARTLFVRIVCFGKTAENLDKYQKKGSKLLVEGELQIRSYEKDHVTAWITEIVTFNIQYLGTKGDSDTSGSRYPTDRQQQREQTQRQQRMTQNIHDDDLPF